MQICWILFNIIWIVINFFITIFQSYFSTTKFLDEKGNLSLIQLLTDKQFLIVLSLWIIINIFFIVVKAKTEKEKKEDSIIAERWEKDKAKLIDDVTSKVKRGDYSGASETIKLIKELNKVVEEDNNG